MENTKPKMKQWQKMLRILSIVSAVISLVFLVLFLEDIFEHAQYIFWVSMTLSQCLDAVVTFDRQSKFSFFRLVIWTLLLAVWVVLLARLLLQ